MKRLWQAGLVAGFLLLPPANAQQTRSPLDALVFLTGRWVSKDGAEMQEENWSPANGNSIIGSFRVVQEGKPVFYEFWAVELEEGKPVLKLKHFNSGLVGWEEKSVSTKMPLTAHAENDAVFAEADGSVSLHYHRMGDTLTCTVHHVRDGKSSDEVFKLTKAM